MSFQLSRKLNWVTIFYNFSTVLQTLYDSANVQTKKVIFQQENFVSQVSENLSHMIGEVWGSFNGLGLPTLRLFHCCPAGLFQPTEAVGKRMEDSLASPRPASHSQSPDSREADRGCRGSGLRLHPASLIWAWLVAGAVSSGRPSSARPGLAYLFQQPDAATRSPASRRHQRELEKRVRTVHEPGQASALSAPGRSRGQAHSNSAPLF